MLQGLMGCRFHSLFTVEDVLVFVEGDQVVAGDSYEGYVVGFGFESVGVEGLSFFLSTLELEAVAKLHADYPEFVVYFFFCGTVVF